MGYVEQLMGTGEEIVMRSRQHWIALLRSALINGFIIVAAMALRIVVGNVLDLSVPQIIVDVLTAATWVIVVFALIRFGWDSLQWWAEEYIITNRRVMQSEGIINKRTVDSSLEKVNDVVLIQSFFGRILGYGTLQIVTGSDVGVNRLHRLRDPIAFKTAMLDEKAKLSGDFGEYLPAGAVRDSDVPRLIADLDALRKRGLITEAEFAEKKAKLLSQL